MRANEFISHDVFETKTAEQRAEEIMQSDLNDKEAKKRKKDRDPIMIPPLQQAIELQKASLGKDSKSIRGLTQDEPTIEKPKDNINKPTKKK